MDFFHRWAVVGVTVLALEIAGRQIEIIPQVETEEGTLQGKTRVSRDGREFLAFEGFRYVEKPERFKLAPPLEKWEGVRDALKEGEPCAQQYIGQGAMMGTFGSEDCLFMNVYTPHKNEDRKYPVMVWIYGGAFIMGSAKQYEPDYFMDEDIVLVMFNYRIGALGFLYNEDDSIPGNLGMKDQVEALKWVKRNIHHFRGDPNSITVFGESAGGVSVHYHMLSEMSTGLFHKAIAQSGSANMPWAINTSPRWSAKRYASELNCPETPTSEMVACLSKVEVDDLVDAQLSSLWGPIWGYVWAPVIEVDAGVDDSTAFIRRHPEELIAEGKVASKVPLLTGLMKNEGSMIFTSMLLPDSDLVHDLNSNWSTVSEILFFLGGNVTKDHIPDSAPEIIRDFYFGHHSVGPETEQAFTDIFSDRYFVQPLYNSMMAMSEIVPTYGYLFTFFDGFSVVNMFDYFNLDPPTHGDDLGYLFPTMFRMFLKTEKEKTFSHSLVSLWASFAATGKPEKLWGNAQTWPAVNSSERPFMWYRLDTETQYLKDPFQERVKFWDNFAPGLKTKA